MYSIYYTTAEVILNAGFGYAPLSRIYFLVPNEKVYNNINTNNAFIYEHLKKILGLKEDYYVESAINNIFMYKTGSNPCIETIEKTLFNKCGIIHVKIKQ